MGPLSRRCLRIFAGGVSSSSSPFGAAAISQHLEVQGEEVGTYRYIIILLKFDSMRDFEIIDLFKEV